MGNRPISIGVESDQSVYTAGSTIRGTVYLSVSSKQGTTVPAQSVQLRLVGKESAVVHHQSSHNDSRDNNHTEDHYERSTHTFFQLDYPLHTYLNQRASVGQFEFPFSIPLPQNLPSSLRERTGQSYCEVEYELIATLVQPGSTNSFFRSNPNGTKKLEIQATLPTPGDTSVEHPEDIIPVKCCCCTGQGSMSLQSAVDRTVAIPNDTVGIRFRCQNHSSNDVDMIRVQLEQTVEWSSNMHKRQTRKILDRKELSTESFQELMPNEPKSAVCCFSNGYRNIQEIAMSQAWHTAQIQVPQHSMASYEGQAVSVRHVVSVILVSNGCCNSNPESSTLMHVTRAFSDVSGNQLEGKYSSSTGFSSPVSIPQPSAPLETFADAPVIAEAQALPQDWNAQTAEVIEIPMAQAIVIEPSAPIESPKY